MLEKEKNEKFATANLLTRPTRSAWSLIYMFHAKKAFKSRRPGPLALVGVVAAQAAVFGTWYNERRGSFGTDD